MGAVLVLVECAMETRMLLSVNERPHDSNVNFSSLFYAVVYRI